MKTTKKMGRPPKKKVIDSFVDLKPDIEKLAVATGTRCACGNPIARGQTYVCIDHQKTK